MPAVPVATSKPPPASVSAVQALARSSSNAVSGWSWMSWLSLTSRDRSSSMAWRAASFCRSSWAHGWTRYSMTAMTSPGPTDSPAWTLTSLTVPAFSALTLFSIFMASSTQMV